MKKDKKVKTVTTTTGTGNFYYTYPPNVCPTCGACPTCGRKAEQPYQPTYWWGAHYTTYNI